MCVVFSQKTAYEMRIVDLSSDGCSSDLLGSVSAADQTIGLSQPAVTQGMARLKLQLGRTLFERRKEGMIPTEAGAILCAQSEKAMAILSGGIRRARDRRSVV